MELQKVIKGLHHVTATVNDAQEDYDFYTKVLGLRLVKETVNFDNEAVYHFYYADEIGNPSTVFTTFPYKDQGVRQGVIGNGQVVQTSFSIPHDALDFWEKRLINNGLSYSKTKRFGLETLVFTDPSGLVLDLKANPQDTREDHIWSTDDIPKSKAIKGIHSVTFSVEDGDATGKFLENFGYRKVMGEDNLTLYEVGEGGPGNSVIMRSNPDGDTGINGLGTVHHVAHRVADLETLEKVRNYIEDDLGIDITEVKDRKYFKSIYFRIPGNVLFEVATEEPGFLIDEDKDELGTSLKLPDWQEVRREEIEKNLIPYER
ncbi:MAG: glyoxalase [Balneola sp.]|nr:glyoxalase [Balneola sp.]|tara:strand:+ start:83895 stop:84845 length:951 start_codon:yes stop_codon:yes gene_type:complete